MGVKKLLKRSLSFLAAAGLCLTVIPYSFTAKAAPNTLQIETVTMNLHYEFYVSDSYWSTIMGRHHVVSTGADAFCLDRDLDQPGSAKITYNLQGLANDYLYSVYWHSKNRYGTLDNDEYYITNLAMHRDQISKYASNGTRGQDSKSQYILDEAKTLFNLAETQKKSPDNDACTLSVTELSGGGGYISGSNYVIGTYQVNTNASDYNVNVIPGSTTGISITKLANKQFRVTVPLSNTTSGYYMELSVHASKNVDALYIYHPASGNYQRMAVPETYTTTKTVNVVKQRDDPTGIIHLYKRDSETNQLLQGAIFRITNKTTGNTYFKTTDSNGYASVKELPIGIYKVEEMTAPNGYVIGNNVWDNIQITESNYNHTFTAYNKKQVGRITVLKRDVETGSVPQGDATLNNARFNILDSSGNLVQTLTLSGTSGTTGNLPLGTYTVVETQAPTGYKLASPVTVTIEYAGQNVEIANQNTTVYDSVIKGKLRITKTGDKKLGVTDDETKPRLSGVEFQVRLKSSGVLYDTVTTDENGVAITQDLPYGTYVITESKGKTGYQISSPVEVVINSEGIQDISVENKAYASEVTIYKQDSTTNKTIPVAGVEFGIKDTNGNWVEQNGSHIFATDSTGKVTLPQPLTYGNYTLVELKAPAGYVRNTSEIQFEVKDDNMPIVLEMKNSPVMGTITVTKTGEVLSSVNDGKTPVFSKANLSGAEFNVVAATDITTPDGTVRYAAGTVVDTLRTDGTGKDTTIPLYLGTYNIIETKAPSGFVINTTPVSVTLSYKDQDTPNISESTTINNVRQKVSVSLKKDFEKADGQTEIPNSKVTFGLFAAEDIVAADGSKIAKDTLIEVLNLDDNGNATTKTDLPIAAYYVKELSTHDGYVLDETKYAVTYLPYDMTTTTIKGTVNEDVPIGNLLKRGDLVVQKTAEGENLEGFEFRIRGTTTIGTVYDKVFTTDEEGKIVVTGLLVGTYEIEELSNDKTIGYIIPEPQTIEIPGPETYTVNFDNRYERHALIIKKTSENGVVEGFGFRVTGTTLVGIDYDETFYTNAEGLIVIEGLLLGEYTITEIANDVSKPFILCEPQTIEITTGATEPFEVYFYNALLRGSTDLVKVDARTGKPLAGVQFVITDAEGNIVATLVTDENGIANTGNLPYGKYYIIEVKAREGYILDDTQYEFTITEHKQVVEFRLSNEKITGSIEIRKKNENGNPMKNVEFTIIDADTNEVVDVIVTDENGYAKSKDLEFGNYILRETKTPNGYLPADDQYFSITQDKEIITYEIINNRSPRTGEATPYTAFGLVMLSLFTLIISVILRFKARKKVN